MKFIAEFCQNHNGDFAVLQEMIHQAAEGGAYYGKIQTIFADDLVYRPRFEEGENINGQVKVIKRPYLPEYERLKALELTFEQQAKFVMECRRFGLVPLTTAFSKGCVSRIREAGFKEIKIASYDCASLPLLEQAAETFESIILSTGATYDVEIEAAAHLLKAKNKPFSMLHCVTLYPTPLNQIHLRRMEYLKQFTPSVGLSEHTLVERDGIKASVAAIYCGAEIIERHFRTLAPELSRDGRVSIGVTELKELVAFSKLSHNDQKQYLDEKVPEFTSMLGEASRALSSEELLNRDYYRGRFATHMHHKPNFNWEPGPSL